MLFDNMSAQKVFNISLTDCTNYEMPAISDYFTAITYYGDVLIVVGGLILFTIIVLFLDTLIFILKWSSPKVKSRTAFILAVYPITSLAALSTLIIPRAYLVSEVIIQITFMTALYQLFCNLIDYCGGETKLILQSKGHLILSTKVGPCCCWPCCSCLPTLQINKKVLRNLRLLVLQLPIVQSLIYIGLLISWAEQENTYKTYYKFAQPVIVISIMLAVWSMAMTIRMLNNIIGNEKIVGKFISLQLVLVCSKLQGFIIRTITWCDIFKCQTPLSSILLANVTHNSLLLLEMLILCLLARVLYKNRRAIKEGHQNDINTIEISTVRDIFTKIHTIPTTPVCLMYRQQTQFE